MGWEDVITRLKGIFYRSSSLYLSKSSKWTHWLTVIDGRECPECFSLNGKIIPIEQEQPMPTLHEKCRCRREPLPTVLAGHATIDGKRGADWALAFDGVLPGYYISKEEAILMGWESWKGNLAVVSPGKVIGGEVFKNRGNKLPNADGRVWYEADINYTGGYRASHRIVYSNDGLIFVSYDHYTTFVEVERGGDYAGSASRHF